MILKRLLTIVLFSRWSVVDPGRFRQGQVVQLEVAFRVVPTSSRSLYRMVPLLRTVALMDSHIYMVSTA